jgi:gliding motility-associated-like protein
VSGIRITVTAADSVGNVSSDSSITVELDNFPPKLELEGPTPSTKPAALIATVTEARIQVKGETEPDAKVTVEPRGTIGIAPEASVGADGKFSALVALNVGKNTVRVTATDAAGNQTLEELTILYRPLIKAVEGGEVYLPEKRDDGIEGNDTRVVVPAGAVGQDISIEISQRELESVPPAMDNPDIGRGSVLPLAAYEFTVKDRDGQGELSMAFLKPIEVYLQYQDLDKLGGPAMVFKWDGVRWNMIGGVWDESKKTVEIRVNSLSVFAIFQVIDLPKEFKLAGAYPNPFTPNDDDRNDVVTFYFDNPNNADAVIRIFDLRGVLVRKLENGLTSWDGLDDEGQPAEMGVYIYQIEVEDGIEGNTIVLAR